MKKMTENIEIKLISSEVICSIIPLLRVLNSSISEETLRERLGEMVSQGYKCAGMFLEGKLIGICGLWVLTKFYVGKHIEPDNMIVLPEYRSQKLGNKMMSWIYKYGKSQGCISSELNCYLSNERGHQFWENEGYRKIAFHFQKNI